MKAASKTQITQDNFTCLYCIWRKNISDGWKHLPGPTPRVGVHITCLHTHKHPHTTHTPYQHVCCQRKRKAPRHHCNGNYSCASSHGGCLQSKAEEDDCFKTEGSKWRILLESHFLFQTQHPPKCSTNHTLVVAQQMKSDVWKSKKAEGRVTGFQWEPAWSGSASMKAASLVWRTVLDYDVNQHRNLSDMLHQHPPPPRTFFVCTDEVLQTQSCVHMWGVPWRCLDEAPPGVCPCTDTGLCAANKKSGGKLLGRDRLCNVMQRPKGRSSSSDSVSLLHDAKHRNEGLFSPDTLAISGAAFDRRGGPTPLILWGCGSAFTLMFTISCCRPCQRSCWIIHRGADACSSSSALCLRFLPFHFHLCLRNRCSHSGPSVSGSSLLPPVSPAERTTAALNEWNFNPAVSHLTNLFQI